MSPSNLGYHATALRYSGRRWEPFRSELGRWLRSHVPDPAAWDGLLILGPSGAYCVPAEWLAGFREIVAYEPDSVARWVFKRRFGRRTSVRIQGDDLLELSRPGMELTAFREVLARYPRHLVVFSNLLGQLRFFYPWIADRPELFEEWKVRLRAALAQRAWLSFHDRLSGELRPQFATLRAVDRELLEEELLSRFYSSQEPVELLDHLTGGILPEVARAYLSWELAPRHHHLIEAIAQIPRV